MEILGYVLIAIVMIGGVVGKIQEDRERERKKKERKEAREERYRRKQLERQLRYDRWQKLRHEFDELKETSQFKRWKSEQYLCQEKKCAWCKKLSDSALNILTLTILFRYFMEGITLLQTLF